MLNAAPINDKLLIAAGITLTCTVIIGVWSVFQFEKLYIEMKKFDDFWLTSIHSAHNLQRTLTSLHGTLNDAANRDDMQMVDSSLQQQYQSYNARAEQSFNELAHIQHEYKRYIYSFEEHELMQQLGSELRAYLPLFHRTLRLLKRRNTIAENSIEKVKTARGLAQTDVQDSMKIAFMEANLAFSRMLTISNNIIEYNTRRTNAVALETLRHFLHSRLFVTVGLVAAIFISLVVNWLIARSIVRRLRLIQIAAERISNGNLHVRIAMNEPDEIGRLARAFNRMSENLHDTLANLADEQVRERHAQLEALQAQLAPHFLFNSLTALGGLIMNNKHHAIEFLEKLSYTYRYVLTHQQQHLVTVEDELNFVQAYAFLASIRFRDGFDVQINVPPEYLPYKLPAMALQLLLENAVKHNVVSADQPLRIWLEISHRQQYPSSFSSPYLSVRNNIQKRTMSINTLVVVSASTQNHPFSESTNVGLQNLQNRYKLLTNQVPEILTVEEEFIVMLPLVK